VFGVSGDQHVSLVGRELLVRALLRVGLAGRCRTVGRWARDYPVRKADCRAVFRWTADGRVAGGWAASERIAGGWGADHYRAAARFIAPGFETAGALLAEGALPTGCASLGCGRPACGPPAVRRGDSVSGNSAAGNWPVEGCFEILFDHARLRASEPRGLAGDSFSANAFLKS
jgi:hypothetical protein